MAVIKVMERHFPKLCSKIDNVKTEVSMVKTMVASLIEENKKLREVRGNAADLEMQPPMTPRTPKMDLTIRPQPQLELRNGVGTRLAREILTRNWENQVKKDNPTLMNIDELDVEPGRLGKAPRFTSPPPTLMHSQYTAASATVKSSEDHGGKIQNVGRTRSLPNPRERQRRRRGRAERSCGRVTELRNTITHRQEENVRCGKRPGGRGGQQKRGEFEALEREKEKYERPRWSPVITSYDDGRGVMEVFDCRGGRYQSWRPRKG